MILHPYQPTTLDAFKPSCIHLLNPFPYSTLICYGILILLIGFVREVPYGYGENIIIVLLPSPRLR